MLVGLHGAQAGLSSERTYTFKVLPRGVVQGLADALFHHDLIGFARAGAIVVGLAATMSGYLVGIISRHLVLDKSVSTNADHDFKQSLHSNN
jgi:hypothetical protein